MKQKKTRNHGAGADGSRHKDTSSHESMSVSTGSFDSAEFTDPESSPHVRSKSSGDKRRVRFKKKRNVLHEVEPHSEFSAKERSNYWWSEREKDRMMAKHERLVAKYEQQKSGTKLGKKMSADKLGSCRGLESWTAAGSMKLDHTIEQCITAVMDEQDRQWNENDDDADIIAQKSFAVTEDSARRARLNGLQDAQEALRIRGENWSKKNSSDEMSVGSVISTGTAAVAKKKKRSKLLARLDDSAKLMRNTSSTSLGDSKKDGKKTKKTKKTKTKKTKKLKKSKSKDITEEEESTTKRARESDDGDTSTTHPNTVSSNDEQDRMPLNNVSVPVSPLRTPDETSSNQVYPLVAALRQEQEKLKQNPDKSQESALSSIYDRESGTDSDEDDIVALLRQQQRKQAISWSSPSRKGGDPGEGGNQGIPERSGAPVNKLSSLREEYTRTPSESANMSDPPGRRPRRLASTHGNSEGKSPSRSKKKSLENEYSDTSALLLPEDDSARRRARSTFKNRDGSGKKSIELLRSGAKSLFRKGAKV